MVSVTLTEAQHSLLRKIILREINTAEGKAKHTLECLFDAVDNELPEPNHP